MIYSRLEMFIFVDYYILLQIVSILLDHRNNIIITWIRHTKKKHTQAHQHSRVKFNKDDISKSTHVVKIELIKRGGAKAFYRFFLQRSAINHFFFHHDLELYYTWFAHTCQLSRRRHMIILWYTHVACSQRAINEYYVCNIIHVIIVCSGYRNWSSCPA